MVPGVAVPGRLEETSPGHLDARQDGPCSPTPIWYFFGVARSSAAQAPTVARTIRFSAGLREKIAADADRCGRSFEGQVIALLRRHYGEDVDIAPSPAEILALATASLVDISPADIRVLERKLKTGDR
jgi:hypothetical protein